MFIQCISFPVSVRSLSITVFSWWQSFSSGICTESCRKQWASITHVLIFWNIEFTTFVVRFVIIKQNSISLLCLVINIYYLFVFYIHTIIGQISNILHFYLTAYVSTRTAIGLVCKDGVVLAVEKIVTSKLYEPGTNKRLFSVDTHAGIVRAKFFSLNVLSMHIFVCFTFFLNSLNFYFAL